MFVVTWELLIGRVFVFGILHPSRWHRIRDSEKLINFLSFGWFNWLFSLFSWKWTSDGNGRITMWKIRNGFSEKQARLLFSQHLTASDTFHWREMSFHSESSRENNFSANKRKWKCVPSEIVCVFTSSSYCDKNKLAIILQLFIIGELYASEEWLWQTATFISLQ